MTEATSIVARVWRKAGRISTRLVRTLNLDGVHPVRVAVLMYHKVGPVSHSEWWVSTADFAAQIRAFKAYGYTPVTFAELNEFRTGLRRPPHKPIILTFDDGYRDILTDVLPVLQRAESAFKATVFIPTSRVGGDNRWDTGIDFAREPVARHLTWDEIRVVAQTGLVDFQAHTVTHPKLPDLETSDVDRELVACRKTLERELERPIRYFSYPFSLGAHVPRVRDAVRRAGYLGAVGVDDIIEPDSRDPWNIRRLSIFANTTLSHRPGAAEPFLFGPTLLNDADVPRANVRDARVSFRGVADAPLSKAVAATSDPSCEISVSGNFEAAVSNVCPCIEIRSVATSGGAPAIVRLSSPGGARRIDAGGFAQTWTGKLPPIAKGAVVEVRFALTDSHACLQPFVGEWARFELPR